ncbi:hypothetical protein CsatB_028931 [Cannabis sativa]
MRIRSAFLFSLVVLIQGLVFHSSSCYGGRIHGLDLYSHYSHHPTPSLSVVVHKVGDRSPPPAPKRNPPKLLQTPPPPQQQQQPLPPPPPSSLSLPPTTTP